MRMFYFSIVYPFYLKYINVKRRIDCTYFLICAIYGAYCVHLLSLILAIFSSVDKRCVYGR